MKWRAFEGRRWIPIDLGHLGSFEVEIRNPTYDELTEDAANQWQGGNVAGHRIESAITDWRGLEDGDGKPIPFHVETMRALCESVPAAFGKLMIAANEAFRGLPEDAAKNSPPTPKGSSGEAATK